MSNVVRKMKRKIAYYGGNVQIEGQVIETDITPPVNFTYKPLGSRRHAEIASRANTAIQNQDMAEHNDLMIDVVAESLISWDLKDEGDKAVSMHDKEVLENVSEHIIGEIADTIMQPAEAIKEKDRKNLPSGRGSTSPAPKSPSETVKTANAT